MNKFNAISDDVLTELQMRAKANNCDLNTLLKEFLAQDTLLENHLPSFDQQLLESVGQAIIATNLEGIISYWNHAAEVLYGWQREEVMGKSIIEITPSEMSQTQAFEIMEQLALGDRWQGEFVVKKRDGTDFIALVTDHPIHDHNNNLVGIIGTSIDISEQKQLEQQLRASESRLQSLLDSQTAYVVRVDLEGRYTYANQAFLRVFSWIFPDENTYLIDSTLGVHADDVPKMLEILEQCLKFPNEPQKVLLRKYTTPKTFLWTSWEFITLSDESGIISEIQCVGINVTHEKEFEQALRESEQLYRLLADNSQDGISLHTPDGAYLYVNPYREQMTGYSSDELINKPIEELPDMVHPDDLSHTRDEPHQQVKQGKLMTSVEYRLRHKEGHYIWVETNSVPITDEEGNVKQILANTRDITERKNSQQMLLENERLRLQFKKEQDRSQLIGRFLSTFNHDVRTSLGVILTSRDMLIRYYDRFNEEERLTYLDRIERHVRLSLTMLDNIIDVHRNSEKSAIFQPQPVNIAILCRVSIDEMRKEDSHHDLLFNKLSQQQVYDIDEILVSRILLNLLANAIKYSPKGGTITLELDEKEQHLILRVRDEGIGIAEQNLSRIFDSYYRIENDEDIDGTGLGLSIVKECVEQHNGHITVESQVGIGSTFIVALPAKISS